MGLNTSQTAASLSLATSMIGGFKLQFGTMTKALHAGLAAQAGINAAIMASNGITASSEVFDGDSGITAMWSDTDPSSFAENILPGNDKLTIEREGLYVKCYPSCGYTSRAIDGMIELVNENNLEASSIIKIEIDVPDRHATVAKFLVPENTMQARFSFPFCLAIAVLFRAARIEHFSAAMLDNAALLNLMQATKVMPYAVDPGLEDLSAQAPDRIRVFLKDGRCIEKCIAISRGSPEHPLDRKELFEKFWSCIDPALQLEHRHAIEGEFDQFAGNESVDGLVKQLKILSKSPL